MPDLVWTREPPSVAGYYWVRNPKYPDNGPHIRVVSCKHIVDGPPGQYRYVEVEATSCYDETWGDDECRKHEWAGPIPEPAEGARDE